jgi:hypothetical protein
VGKIVGLSRTVQERFGPLEADFQRYYGLNLTDALFGPEPISSRRLFNLVVALPPGSATHRDADSSMAWTAGEHLLANIVDLLQENTMLTARSPWFKGSKDAPPQLERQARPGQRPAHADEPAPEELKEAIDAYRRRLISAA